MKYNTYKAVIRKSNRIVETKFVDATDTSSAKTEASRYGKVLRVVPVKATMVDGWLYAWRERKKMKTHTRIEFLQTMSNMLVGYTIGEALSIMVQNFSGKIKDLSRKLRHLCVHEQMDPVDAMHSLGEKYFPSVTIAIIRSNAKVVSLAEAFREGLEFEREIGKLQSSYTLKIGWAMFTFLISIITTILSHIYGWDLLDEVNYFVLMPEEGTSIDMLNDTKFFLAFSAYMAMAIGTIWLAMFIFFGAGRDISPETVERWVLRVPLIRGAMLSRTNFVATYQIYKLLSKGVKLLETFKHVHNEQKDGVLKADLARVIYMLEDGNAEYIDGFHSFTDLDRALLKSANRQDEVANVFQAQSDQFLTTYKRSVQHFVLLHNYIMYFFAIMLVLILTMLMFLPMVGGFDLVDQL
jgi:type II secretory pathway component PulF